MYKYLLFLFAWELIVFQSSAQNDSLSSLESMLEEVAPAPGKDYTQATFKGTRLVNFHTVETLSKGSLDLRISHRFGDFSSGASNFWGLDGPANIRIGLDYSLLNNLVIGLGRTSSQKMVDGFVKYKFLRQTNDQKMPVSAALVFSTNVTTLKDANAAFNGYDKYEHFSSRLSYMFQLLLARKFSSKLSFQLAPTLIHYNLVEKTTDKNDILALVSSGRFKFTKRMALTGEYVLRPIAYVRDMSQYHNSASLGLDIETGGHVFQLFVTNSFGINEVEAIPYTFSNWSKGQVRLGFNVSRVF